MSDQIIIVFGRNIDVFDDFDEAKRSAWYQNSSDEGWFDRIEILGSDGSKTVLNDDDIPEFAQWEDEEDNRWRASAASNPHVASLYIDGHVFESFYGADGEAKANAELERLRPFLGDRITLRKVKR